MNLSLNDVMTLVFLNVPIDFTSDEDLYTLMSVMVLGLVSRDFVRSLFVSQGNMPYEKIESGMFDMEGCAMQSKTLIEVKALARKMELIVCEGVSEGMCVDFLIDYLAPFEKSLGYLPAKAIGRIRQYSEHLKNKEKVVRVTGKAIADSLTWLNDTTRPFYRLPHSEQITMDDMFETKLLKSLYRGTLCSTCCKTYCMQDFCLMSYEMEELECELKPNPHGHQKPPMKLYVVEDVLYHAVKKHGGWEKFKKALVKQAPEEEDRSMRMSEDQRQRASFSRSISYGFDFDVPYSRKRVRDEVYSDHQPRRVESERMWQDMSCTKLTLTCLEDVQQTMIDGSTPRC